MKICICRSDYEEAAMAKAIQTNPAAHAEDIHPAGRSAKPQCGACLCVIHAMATKYQQTGEVPARLDVTPEEIRDAQEALGARYNQEAKPGEKLPFHKRRYVPT